jgi:uncharacterized protein (TIGR02466 family)
MIDPGVHLLFGIPLFHSNEYQISIKEKNFLIKLCQTNHLNEGNNNSSSDQYILNHSELTNLKKYFDSKIEEYTKKYLKISYLTEFYITQSWVNKTPQGTYHHEHSHPNSILSAVYFITESLSQITFKRDSPLFSTFQFAVEEYNNLNSESWRMPDVKNSLYLFPSTLKHFVPINNNKETRYTLSFNVFAKGVIGRSDRSTALKI